MKKVLGYVALGVCAYVAFVIALFPADRAYAFVRSQLGDTLLYDVRGTVWHGKAAAVQVGGQTLRAVRWSVAPWTVLLGRVDVDLAFDSGESWGNGTLGLGVNKVLQVRDLELQLPGAEVRSLLPRITVPLAGVFTVTLQEGRFNPETRQVQDLRGAVTWHNAALDMPNAPPLGTFRVDLEPGAEGIVGSLKDTGEGPLVAQGTLLLKPDNTYQFTGNFMPREAGRTEIAQGLMFLGRPDAEGRVKVNYNGAL